MADYAELPWDRSLLDKDGKPTLWFQQLWQRAVPVHGSGTYASTSGAVAIPHGLGVAPPIGSVSVQFIGSSAVVASLVSTDRTHINVMLYTASSGATVSDDDYTLAWRANRP